jgi:hypothetical protein
MAERITRKFKPFKIGQKVWFEGKNLKTGYPYSKLTPLHKGPFTITEARSRFVYKLCLPRKRRIHPIFHASLLTPYTETSEHRENFPRPPPDLIDGEEEQEIEAIINHKTDKELKKYLVTWLRFPTKENEWLTKDVFNNAKQILQEYKERHNLT